MPLLLKGKVKAWLLFVVVNENKHEVIFPSGGVTINLWQMSW